jgi:hypothetical protein
MILQLYSIAVALSPSKLLTRNYIDRRESSHHLPRLEKLSDLFFVNDYQFIRFKLLSGGFFIGDEIRHATFALFSMIYDE